MTFATDQNPDDQGLSATSRRLLALREEVISRWVRETRAHLDLARELPHPILINTLPAFYDNLIEALAPGYPRARADSNADIAGAHGDERARMTAYGPDQIIHEYQLFRDAFIGAVASDGLELDRAQWAVFHASIDTAVRDAVRNFTLVHRTLRHRVAAALSHDMRGPLSTIMNGARLLGLRADAGDPCQPTIARILDNGQRLNDMCEELLEALSVDQRDALPLAVAATDLFDIAGAVCRAINESGPGQCQLTGQPVPGYWCPNAMRRALENLTGNAVKYGDGKPVRIHVAHTHERAILSVHNSGNPIPSANRDRIFEYLRRDDSDKATGWGIGLPFVRSVAESHGGSVLVDSSSATGTTFTIDVPIDCRPFVAASPPARP